MFDSILRRLARGRQLTLPDFLIIGGQRCGTTSLFHYMALHPEVLPADTKEVHFFDYQYHHGLDWYRARFPTRERGSQRAGEASPYYLFHPLTPGRVQAVLPEVKLIVLLRNPVERAYSHYHLTVHHGHELCSFEEALEHEERRLTGEVEAIRADPAYRSRAHQYLSYQARGRYAEQLAAWFAHFPREQFLILSSEELDRDPASGYRRVLEFVGLPEWKPPRFARLHGYERADMAPATRRRLAALFAPENEKLYRLLGRDLGWD